jgi:hypothetical protein
MRTAPRARGLRQLLPEASRLWICHTPSAWPGASGWWTHLADRALGSERSGRLPELDAAAATDVVYLPPAPAELASGVERLARELEGAGAVVARQRAPGDGEAGRYDVLDPLSVLVEHGAGGLRGLETACRAAVWPLVAGLTDRSEAWCEGLEALAAAGVETVVPMRLDLDPPARRRLAERTEEGGFEALFHGPSPDERACARAVAAAGLRPWLERPALGGSPRREFARRVAAELIVTAELWLRLARPEAAGQELLRAGRWAERDERDLRALAREGNLDVMPWLDARGRALVEDLAADRPSALRTELEADYLRAES